MRRRLRSPALLCAAGLATAVTLLTAPAAHATGGDPLPYGVESNRAALERLLDHAVAQKILYRRPDLDALFAKGTHDLTA